jgi:hypothetical protein
MKMKSISCLFSQRKHFKVTSICQGSLGLLEGGFFFSLFVSIMLSCLNNNNHHFHTKCISGQVSIYGKIPMNAIANFREQKTADTIQIYVIRCWYMTKGGTFLRLQLFDASLLCTR